MRQQSFDVYSDHATAAEQWTHWISSFEHFVEMPKAERSRGEIVQYQHYFLLGLQDNFSLPLLREIMNLLHTIYVKPKNDVFARNLLVNRMEEDGESRVLPNWIENTK